MTGEPKPGDVLNCAAPAAGGLLRFGGDAGPVEWAGVEASEGGARKFTMTAYTGGPMNLGYGVPVYVDIAGLSVPRQDIPILKEHDPERVVGHATSVEKTPQRVKIAGVVSGVGPAADEVKATSAAGFPWQSSIGAQIGRMERVDAGQPATVNGRTVTGPALIMRAGTLRESSFTALGADGATSAAVTAHFTRESGMSFESWVTAEGFDPATLTAGQRKTLEAAYKAAHPPAPPPNPPGDLENIAATARAENARRQAITDIAARYMQSDPTMTDQFESVAKLAIQGNWDGQRAEYEMMKLSYGRGPAVVVPTKPDVTERVLEAALCQTAGLKDAEKAFAPETLDAAHRSFRGGLGLLETIDTVAKANGYRGRGAKHDLVAAMRYAATPIDLRASGSGPSNYSLAGILGNLANKFIREAFMAVEQAWREFAAIGSVNDFKTRTTFSLTGDLQFDRLPKGGEVKHATLGEVSYTNQADTYAKMLGLDRRDLINDDLGAFTQAGRRLGRGGALKINDVFWSTFLNNGAFFTSGRGNAFTGSGTALGTDSLVAADAAFRAMTDPDGKPLGSAPRILLVPNGLRIPALRLMNSQNVVLAGTAGSVTERGEANPVAGLFRVVSSVYLSNASYTGYSPTAWYLLADPADLPVIEVVFLNGVDMPTVETSELDFNQLGIALRAYGDFGCQLQEYRGGQRNAGA